MSISKLKVDMWIYRWNNISLTHSSLRYDIVLDVLVVNQTGDTLEGLTLELATLGDLKLVEKPSPITLAPHDFANIKANAKVGCSYLNSNFVVTSIDCFNFKNGF